MCVCVCVHALSHSVISNSLRRHDCGLSDFSVLGDSPARILEWVAMSSSRESSQPRDWTQVSRTAGRLFTDWAPGKPKNTAVGSHSLLQGIFPTLELNWGLLHYRQIFYQLNCQRSPLNSKLSWKNTWFCSTMLNSSLQVKKKSDFHILILPPKCIISSNSLSQMALL